MVVEDPTKGGHDADSIFNQARQMGATQGPFEHNLPLRSFTGTGRQLSGEMVPAAPQPPENVVHNIYFWSNGFTVNDGPLRRLDDPTNSQFLESIKRLECPRELQPTDPQSEIHINLLRREQEYQMYIGDSNGGLRLKDAFRDVVHQASIYGIALGYCISASLLSIINKWAVMKFPYPGALTALQYLTSSTAVLLFGRLKLLDHDPLDPKKMLHFLPAAVIFYLSLFTNSELLLHANVDTFIVFRSAVPIFVAVGEALFLGQPWPTTFTWASLSTIFGGSLLYVFTDHHFTVTAYIWALTYLASMTVDFVYIKHVVMTIGLGTWGLVLYNNLEALMLFPLEFLVMGELKKMEKEIPEESNWISVILPVGLSCLLGLTISFFGFSCRRAISATGFTVLGIVNKLLTVVVNLVVWDRHSTLAGTIGLLVCMFGGVLYQKSTSLVNAKSQRQVRSEDGGVEEERVLLEMPSVQDQKMDEVKIKDTKDVNND